MAKSDGLIGFDGEPDLCRRLKAMYRIPNAAVLAPPTWQDRVRSAVADTRRRMRERLLAIWRFRVRLKVFVVK